MAANIRRLWFVVPSHYINKFDDGNPELTLATEGEEQGRKALNSDLDDPMITDGTPISNFYLYLGGIGPFNSVYFEAGNWFDSGVYNLEFEAGVGYATSPNVDEVIGQASKSGSVMAPTSTGSPFLGILANTLSESLVRLRFYSFTPVGNFEIPNIWIGMAYQMDAMYSLGSTKGHSFIQKPYERSASGVPITQRRTGATYGTTIRRWSLSFEWIDEDQLQDLKDIYAYTQGFRPFKMIAKNDGTASTDPDAYSVAFSDKLNITEVADGYYTVTIELIEHN